MTGSQLLPQAAFESCPHELLCACALCDLAAGLCRWEHKYGLVVRFVIGRTRSPEQRKSLHDEVAHHGAFLNLPIMVSLGALLATSTANPALPEGSNLPFWVPASAEQKYLPLLLSLPLPRNSSPY